MSLAEQTIDVGGRPSEVVFVRGGHELAVATFAGGIITTSARSGLGRRTELKAPVDRDDFLPVFVTDVSGDLLFASNSDDARAFDLVDRHQIWQRACFLQAFDATAKLVLAATAEAVLLLSPRTGQVVRSFNHASTGGVVRFGQRVGDRNVLTWSDGSEAVYFEFETGGRVHAIPTDVWGIDSLHGRSVGPLSSFYSDLEVWDLIAAEKRCTLKGGATSRSDLFRFHPDGKRLIQGTQDGTLLIWNLQSGDRIAELPGHCGDAPEVSFLESFCSSPSKWLSVPRRGRPILWDLDAGKGVELGQKSPRSLDEDDALFTSATLDAQHRLWVFTSRFVDVWDVATGSRLAHYSPGVALGRGRIGPNGSAAVCADDKLALLQLE